MELTEARLANCANDLQECRELMLHWWNLAAELLAACKEISYYFHCMTDEDLRLIADMMGDPLPIGAVDAAIAKGHAGGLPITRQQQGGGEEG